MKYSFLFVTLAVVSLLAAGCGDKWNIMQDVLPATGAQVRFIHTAPDAPAIDMFINDQRISGAAITVTNPTGSLLYGSSSVFPASDYASVPAGALKIKAVAAAGGTVASPLLTTDLNAEAGKRYSLFVTGLAPAYSFLTVNDEVPPVAGNTFFLRLVNLVPNSTDVKVTYDGKELITSVLPNKASAFTTIAFPADYKTGLIRTANFQITLNGTVPVVLPVFTIPSIQPGAVITYVFRGLMATDPKVPSKFPPTLVSYVNR